VSCARMTRLVAVTMLLGGLSVSAPVAAAETWVLWARPCDLAGQKCTGDWHRRETFDAERWCKAASPPRSTRRSRRRPAGPR